LLPHTVIQEAILRDTISARTLALDLVRTRDRDRDRDLALALALASDLVRIEALAYSYLSYANTQQRSTRSWSRSLFYRSRGELQNRYTKGTINDYLNIYLTLVVLEERIQGRLPACEGILIVKERTKDGSINTTS
jgi:hypothetical protein